MDEIEREQWKRYTDSKSEPETSGSSQESNLRQVFTAFSDLSALIHETILLLYSKEQLLNSQRLIAVYLQYLQWYSDLPDCLRLGANSTPVVLFAQ